jgi:hypothetical protein
MEHILAGYMNVSHYNSNKHARSPALKSTERFHLVDNQALSHQTLLSKFLASFLEIFRAHMCLECCLILVPLMGKNRVSVSD